MFMQPTEEEEAEELKTLGNDQYKRGNFEKAIDFYTQAIGLCPNNKAYFGNRVLTLLKVERHDEALADCDSIKMLDSDWPKGMHLRAIVLEKLGRLQGAKRELQRLVEIAPDHKVGNTRLAELNKRLSGGSTPAKKKKKVEKKAPTSAASKGDPSKSNKPDEQQKKADKKIQTLTALNTKLMQQCRDSRKENEELKKKLERAEKSAPRPKKNKQEEKAKQDSEELKRTQKKLKQLEETLRTQEDENNKLRQSINKLSGKKMGKWNTEDIFKMIEQHTSQLQTLQSELKKRFGKKRSES